jgi:methylenetetrahydrofolate reductase (NADPH)
LKLKVDQGGEYIITNYFYDTGYFFEFVERCRDIGIEVPIVPGIMPIYSIKMMEMLAGMCGATITEDVRKGLSSLEEGDKEALIEYGIEFAYRQCAELLKAGVPGLHIYTMDRGASTVGLVNRLRADGVFRVVRFFEVDSSLVSDNAYVRRNKSPTTSCEYAAGAS